VVAQIHKTPFAFSSC